MVVNMTTERELLTPKQVAEMCGVGTETVIDWADSGKLPHFRTLGGHRRFRRAEVEAALAKASTPDSEAS